MRKKQSTHKINQTVKTLQYIYHTQYTAYQNVQIQGQIHTVLAIAGYHSLGPAKLPVSRYASKLLKTQLDFQIVCTAFTPNTPLVWTCPKQAVQA